MTDLTDRLKAEGYRNGGQGSYAWRARELCAEAATEIERLTAENATAAWHLSQERTRAENIGKEVARMSATITTLEAELSEARNKALEEARFRCWQIADDIAHGPRAEFADHRQFDCGREQGARDCLFAIEALAKDGANHVD